MKLSFAQDRVLAVMAHPDDAELLCAGTLARARDDGAAIAICVMCDGSKGVASSDVSAGSLSARRQGEARESAKLLGAELFWLGAPDGELFDTVASRRTLIETYRQFRPTLVIAHSTDDYHPDHRVASALAEAASWFAASRGHRTESAPLDHSPALWFADTIAMAGSFTAELHIDVSAHLELKKRMMSCHQSQLSRGGDRDFTPLVDLMIRQSAARGAQANVAAAEVFRQHHAFKRVQAL